GRGAAELIDLHRTEDHQGRGDLFFHRQIVPVRHGYRYVDAGFAGIRDVAAGEALVRELIARTQVAAPD
ncbi:MAG TPA: hypothetical protein VL527_00640, partial [Dongiaceae bacterium]|nr:hypothetical protein [Dongiaceae bacterium]